jgi:hypothetical protein
MVGMITTIYITGFIATMAIGIARMARIQGPIDPVLYVAVCLTSALWPVTWGVVIWRRVVG